MRLNFVEQIIYELFKTEPFHNLYQYYQLPFPKYGLRDGGTCSVKTLSGQRRLARLQRHHIHSQLHNGIVHFNNQSCDHRLLKITLQDKIYFADIGNGWPSIKLFPADKIFKFHCYGIHFHSRPCNNCLKIYQTRNGKFFHSLTIPFLSPSKFFISKQINQHFHEIRSLNKEIRFAQIIGNHFLTLRGDILHTYHKGKKQALDLSGRPLADILHHNFRFDLENFLKVHHG